MSNYPMAEKVFASTHKVENQPPLLEDYDMYGQDLALKEAVQREGAAWAEDGLQAFGRKTGSADWIRLGFEANAQKPVLQTHDPYGHRIDEITYHPAYHQLMTIAKGTGFNTMPWSAPGPGVHVARAAFNFLMAQVEAGHGCPITMSHAAIATLRKQPDIGAPWEEKISHSSYDPRNIPYFEKTSLSMGMAMTEKQGGSDVRTNSTKAYAIGPSGPGEAYELVGHKYFVSAPMSDGFLMLAQSEGAENLSCFLVPRWRPDGSKNPLQIIRLKDKMGNVSNASCETELRGAFGWMIGEEGRGIANILEMVALTRFDCMIGSAAGMRQAVTQITHHCAHRKAFGKKLIDQSLMQNVLADLALEAEAAMAMAMRMARWLDEERNDPRAALLVRIGTAIGKYWICKRTPGHAYEAMECIGGSGTMENSLMPRLYREAPINAIWEGCGNVQCLDVLRILQKQPEALDAYFAEILTTRGENKLFDKFTAGLQQDFADTDNLEYRARGLVERLALAMQASLLIQTGNSLVSDAFCAARLGENSGHLYGDLPTGIDCKAIIERALPQMD